MSNEANTADKKIAGERTVKKKAGRNVVVSPVNVKASGQTRASRELTAPIGLVWNEDTVQASKKPGKAVKKQPERPAITGTGWPDRPPAPKTNKPGPIHYKPSTAKRQETEKAGAAALNKEPVSVDKPEGTGPVYIKKSDTARVKQAAGRKEPLEKKEIQKKEPFSSEEKLDALINNIEKGQTEPQDEQLTGGQRQQAQGQKQSAGNPKQPVKGQQPGPGQHTSQPVRAQGLGAKQRNAGNPMKQGSVLYSPVTQEEARTPISPMQKRPVNTQVWEGPIHQVSGYGDSGYGPKFVRTVVTTTTTTYEPVTEDVIRQITSQTSPAALTENVLNQPAVMPQLTEQQATPGAGAQYHQPGRQSPVRQGQRRPAAGGQRPPAGRQQVQRPAGRPMSQQTPGTGRPIQGGQMNGGQRPPVRQPMQGQSNGQKQSIIGAMESKGSSRPSTGMTQQFAEIEKALGLTNDAGDAGNSALTEAIINNAGVNPTIADGPVPGINNDPGKISGGTGPGINGIGNGAKQPSDSTADPGRENKKSMEYMMLFVEGIIFLIVLAICISIFQKIKKGNRNVDTSNDTAYEETQQPGPEDTGDTGTEDFDVEEAGSGDILEDEQDILDEDSETPPAPAPSGSIDVDNDKFTLRCTNVTVKLDTEGNPAALIYFSFKNKTSEQKAVADVFPISVMQNGEPCDTFAALDEYPEEYYNKDMQISDGSELACAYAVSLKDAVSPITLTVHDNYDTFADVGTTEISLQ